MPEIKKYQEKYKADLQRVCVNTGPLAAQTDERVREYILNTYCDYYLECEPQNVFALVDENDTAQGYIFAAENYKAYRRAFGKYLKRVRKSGLKNYLYVLGEDFFYRLFSRKYPAHLHIDLNEGYRGGGNGTEMMKIQLDNMRNKKIKSIMLIVGTGNVQAIKFYTKNGFKHLLSAGDATVMAKEL